MVIAAMKLKDAYSLEGGYEFFILFFIGIELIYNVVLVNAVPWN